MKSKSRTLLVAGGITETVKSKDAKKGRGKATGHRMPRFSSLH